jgi:2-keto-4-pentenoate hydratase/2-oxohepta-3-ene-1,7-dioic acid hydratase in catechol pathway
MRLARWTQGATTYVGAVHTDRLYAFPARTDLGELLANAETELRWAVEAALTGPGTPVGEIALLPPVVAPSVRDFVAFHQHLEGVVQTFGHEIPQAWFEAPTFYFTNPHSLVGAHEDVAVPPGCEVLDFELEVAAIIGRPGRDLTPAQARDHIVGYTVLNDWSARDLQAREMTIQLGPAKGKDFAATLGPWLVTADELEGARDGSGFLHLDMQVSVNGRVIGTDSLANMAWTFEELVAYASRGTWVRTGDVLGSGTCGSGCLAELWGRSGSRQPPPLQPGDVVTMSVDRLGSISNRVVEGVEPKAVPRARLRP